MHWPLTILHVELHERHELLKGPKHVWQLLSQGKQPSPKLYWFELQGRSIQVLSVLLGTKPVELQRRQAELELQNKQP